MTSGNLISHERLLSLLSYDAGSGIFKWRVGRGRFGNAVKPGDVAGANNGDGYRAVYVDGRTYKEHRLAWFYANSQWPSAQLDHINGNRSDNRLANLRPADARLNNENKRRPNSAAGSGYLGVSFDKARGLWRAQIVCGKKNTNIGRYSSPELAHEAYLRKKREMHAGCTI